MGALRPRIVIESECRRKINGELKFVVVSYVDSEGRKETVKFQNLQEAERFLNKGFRSLRIPRENIEKVEVLVITDRGNYNCKVRIISVASPPRPRLRPRP